MKKLISSLLMMVVLFNFILFNDAYVYAFEGESSITTDSITGEDFQNILYDGTARRG